jgi:NAD(P)-dependent dehydrogenase (short-subunit alcohol dehydrogenase family)
MKDKIIVITGGSSGIGKAAALKLAAYGATLLLVSRNPERGQQALTEIKEKTQNQHIYFYCCDLALLANVRLLATEIQAKYAKIDILINNAGILPGRHTLTTEGFEICWATNHLAGFLLSNLLLPQLLRSEAARIINVSSEAHRMGQIDFQEQASAKNYSSFTAYCDSKLANILFTSELARRLELANVTANCLHPGVIASNFGSTGYGFLKWLFLLGRPFMKSSKQGAATVVYLAVAPEVKHLSGQYFKNKRPVKPASRAQNVTDARRLWDLSELQTGLSTDSGKKGNLV